MRGVVVSSGLLALAVLALGPGLPAQQPTPAPGPSDEQTLKAVSLKTDGAGLLDFFAKRTHPETDRDKLLALVKKLGDKGADARNQATAELVSYGAAAVPALRQGANDLDDTDAAAGARKCLQALDGSAGQGLSAAAVRLLAQARPAGAA